MSPPGNGAARFTPKGQMPLLAVALVWAILFALTCAFAPLLLIQIYVSVAGMSP